MDEPAVAGPSRPRRAPDLADKIISLQRKNASATAPSRVPSRREEVDEFSRGAPPPRAAERMLYDPSRPGPPQHTNHEGRSPLIPRDEALVPLPAPHSHARIDDRRGHRSLNGHLNGQGHGHGHRPGNGNAARDTRERDLRDVRDVRDVRDPSSSSSSRRLFDPSVHDPHHFAPRLKAGPQSQQVERGPSGSGSASSAAAQGGLRRQANGSARTPDEEADRERERRRRREGSERGSLVQSSSGSGRKKDSDGRSKGSRSSEGSESFKDRERGKAKGETGVKAILKDIHDKIKALEAELTEMHKLMSADPEAGISVLFDRPRDPYSREIRSNQDDAGAWLDLIAKHKELADLHHEFLVRVFDPLVPSSLHQLTVRYNIPSRLWQVGYHLVLERLRYAWMSGHPTALDLLTDFVYDAYKFYTDLLEDLSLGQFRTAWIEALGDLARYRMAIASHLSAEAPRKEKGRWTENGGVEVVDGGDDGHAEPSGASIGAEVAESWDVEDKETWRTTARDWYTMGITEKPGEGRLHHHLALLCRDVRGQEGRALHHYTKSLTVTHAYDTSRESILPLFDAALQSQRSLPEATAMDLFVRLHGMLFTKISLDDFPAVLSRFMERLEEDAKLDGISRKATIGQVDWMIMASVNIAAVLQYGSAHGIIRKALAQEGAERRRAQAMANETNEDGEEEYNEEAEEGHPKANGHAPKGVVSHAEDEPPGESVPAVALPPTLESAIKLAFAVFGSTLRQPHRQQGVNTVLNPYITVFLTFLSTLFRQPHVGALLSPYVPWQSLVEFVNLYSPEIKEETKLTIGPPLPEDWTVRGMEWVGRRVYERGFWKGKSNSGGRGSGSIAQPRIGERFASEMDVLLANFDSAVDISEGVVDEVEGSDVTDGPVAVNARRWRRVAWAAGVLLKHVEGLRVEERMIRLVDPLTREIEERRVREDAEKREEENRKARRGREEVVLDLLDTESEEEDPEIAALRDRRSLLRSMLDAPTERSLRKSKPGRKASSVVPGYTMLIFDTNVLLSALDVFRRIVEGGQWSVIVPLPVVTELDGLSKSAPPLGASAQAAVAYLESRIRTHSLVLKIQTSKGNYLSDLLIRTEHVDFSAAPSGHSAAGANTSSRPRTMDDLILNIASFQAEHWVDRSGMLGGSGAGGPGEAKVVLVTDDRNLRLKARGRGVEAMDEKELGRVLGR